jgi:DNA-directed RNA polymerase I subunit RPA2
MEICLVPKRNVPAQFPGLYLFTSEARMIRPVINLATKTTEMIGSFEQTYLNICVISEEAIQGVNI